MLKMKECLTKKVIPLLVATSMAGGMITQTATITLAAENDESSVNDMSTPSVYATGTPIGKIIGEIRIEGNTATANLESGKVMRITFLTEDTFRIQVEDSEENFDKDLELWQQPVYGDPDDPDKITGYKDYPYADILINIDNYNGVTPSKNDSSDSYVLSVGNTKLSINKENSMMRLEANGKLIWEEAEPLSIGGATTQTLKTDDTEFFFGGGQQNGYFSHKGRKINIANESGWIDGQVSSPVPFYVSNKGYGVMRHTWKNGAYDFDSSRTNTINTYHNENRFDAFYFVGDSIPSVIDKFTDLTGKPALLPEFGFYQGHANAYNRDYWKIIDGKKIEKQPDYFTKNNIDPIADGWTLETLNGPANKEGFEYEISAQKVVDDYVNNDMPLGWFLPNDGYGAGYGQENTLQGNLDNLKKFADYAKQNGSQIGLWTQQDIMPIDPDNPKPNDRDIEQEVGYAGVRGLKTDVAWVGRGYSFEVAGVRQAAKALKEHGNNARPFIISLDGWTGTSEAAGLWSGDQTGGNWEYIRFHIPTYIGAGLSGNPNVGSDIDGIFGGNYPEIHTRDFQWKAFTPIEIHMDGWSGDNNPKNPYRYEDPYKSINRMYSKLKAQMLPYTYSTAAAASSVVPGLEDNGKPIIRAMVLEYPDDYHTYGKDTQYQYMYGKNLLVAPVYEGANGEESGADTGIRNNIYLPDENQIWIDYFTGQQYRGGYTLDNFETPLWKIPLFIKNGAIIPMTVENDSPIRTGVTNEKVKHLDGAEARIFEVYPYGDTEFTLYEDDGETLAYLENNAYATTTIKSSAPTDLTLDTTGTATITVGKTEGKYDSINKSKERGTEFIVNLQQPPTKVTAKIGETPVELTKVTTQEEFDNGENVYLYTNKFDLTKYSKAEKDYDKLPMEIDSAPKIHAKVAKTDITQNTVTLTVEGFNNVGADIDDGATEAPGKPSGLTADDTDITHNSVKLNWKKPETGDSIYTYSLEITNGNDTFVVRNIKEETYKHIDLKLDAEYTYRVAATNSKGTAWSDDVFTTKTKKDPYRNVPKNMEIVSITDKNGNDVPDQGSEPREKSVDDDNTTIYHSKWSTAVQFPAEIVIDMKEVFNLDKFEYYPRANGTNGIITKLDFSYGFDGKHWIDQEKDISWAGNNTFKSIELPKINARYIKLTVKSGIGDFISAGEFRPYKVDGSQSYPVGDTLEANTAGGRGELNEGDITELQKYGSIREGDKNWTQIPYSDVNVNNVIDAHDIAYLSIALGDEIEQKDTYIDGQLKLVPSKTDLKAGDKFSVDVVGSKITNLYAFNVDIPIDTTKYEESVTFTPTDINKDMYNFNRVLLSTGGDPATVKGRDRISVMYTNKSNVPSTSNNTEDIKLATINLTAKQDMTFDLAIKEGLLVDNSLHEKDALTDPTGPPKPEPEEPEEQPIKLLSIQALDKDKQAIKDQPGLEVTKAIDGNEDTQWHTYWNNNPDYEENKVQFPAEIIIAMDKAYKLNKFVYVPRPDKGGGTITNATISYSNDNSTWTNITTENWQVDGLSKEYKFSSPVNAKYIKLTIPENGATAGFISAQEFKLYGEEASESDRITISAIEAKDKDNQTVKDQPGSEITKAIDGIDNSSEDKDIWHTYWDVNPDYEPIPFPVNIVLTMDKLYSLNKFEYLPRESGTNGTITNATLSYSADGNTWTESGSVTWAGTGTTETANFTTPISAKYFKITIPEGGSKGGFISAREFKLYGKESTAPTDPEQALKDAVNDAKSILDETQTPNPTINQMLEGIKNLSDAIKNYNSPQN